MQFLSTSESQAIFAQFAPHRKGQYNHAKYVLYGFTGCTAHELVLSLYKRGIAENIACRKAEQGKRRANGVQPLNYKCSGVPKLFSGAPRSLRYGGPRIPDFRHYSFGGQDYYFIFSNCKTHGFPEYAEAESKLHSAQNRHLP